MLRLHSSAQECLPDRSEPRAAGHTTSGPCHSSQAVLSSPPSPASPAAGPELTAKSPAPGCAGPCSDFYREHPGGALERRVIQGRHGRLRAWLSACDLVAVAHMSGSHVTGKRQSSQPFPLRRAPNDLFSGEHFPCGKLSKACKTDPSRSRAWCSQGQAHTVPLHLALGCTPQARI